MEKDIVMKEMASRINMANQCVFACDAEAKLCWKVWVSFGCFDSIS